MKKMLSVMASLAMLIGCNLNVLTASADELHERYENWQDSKVDDAKIFRGFPEGILKAENYFLIPFASYGDNWVQYYDTDETLKNGVGVSVQCCLPASRNALCILNSDDCYNQAVEIFAKYFPKYDLNHVINGGGSMLKFEEPGGTLENAYWLSDRQHDQEDVQNIMIELCKELDSAGLISAFYAPDAIWMKDRVLSVPYLTGYTNTPVIECWDYAVPFDTDAVQSYIDANGLACTIETREIEHLGIMYYVVPCEKATVSEQMALAVQLYDALGIVPFAMEDPAGYYPFTGLENEQNVVSGNDSLSFGMDTLTLLRQNANVPAGDLNLDGTVTVGDAVLLARLVAGDSTLQIAKTAIENADMNSDGMFTADDLTMILKKIVTQS